MDMETIKLFRNTVLHVFCSTLDRQMKLLNVTGKYSSGKKKSLRFVFVEGSLHDMLFTILFNVRYTWIIIAIKKNVRTSGRKYD